MTTTCFQLVDENHKAVLRCSLEAGHTGHHKPRGWTRSKRRRSALAEAKRLILNEEETRDRLAQLMQERDE